MKSNFENMRISEILVLSIDRFQTEKPEEELEIMPKKPAGHKTK